MCPLEPRLSVLVYLKYSFPCFYFLRLFKTIRNEKLTLKIKWIPTFVDEETIPLVQDEDYDDYSTPNTSRIDETHSQNLILPKQH